MFLTLKKSLEFEPPLPGRSNKPKACHSDPLRHIVFPTQLQLKASLKISQNTASHEPGQLNEVVTQPSRILRGFHVGVHCAAAVRM